MKLDSWTRGSEIVLSASDSYWAGAPEIEKVVVRIVGDNSARAQAFEAGLGAIDLFVQAFRVAARRRQLAAQLAVFRAQPLAERNELRHLRLQGSELRLHARALCFKTQAASSSKPAFCKYFMTLPHKPALL